jgi:hypothetical protein
MPIRYWIAAVAFGLIGFVQSGQAQEEADNEQVEVRQQEQPAQSYPLPFPIEIIEDQAESDARERREAEARQREIDDLIAQQGMNTATQAMNDATQRMTYYAKLQTWAVGIGTVLLFGTLWLAWQGNKAAFRAVKITKDIGNKQLRAYVHLSEARAVISLGDSPHIAGVLTINNAGQTPARKVRAHTMWAGEPEPFDESWCDYEYGAEDSKGSIGTAERSLLGLEQTKTVTPRGILQLIKLHRSKRGK